MTASLKIRQEWFMRGARDFARTLPGIAAQHGPEPVYACPLCARVTEDGKQLTVRLFRASTIGKGLTLEHVPLESFGGRELVLTCAPCNHTAGTQLDAHARARENPLEAFRGSRSRPVRLIAGDDIVVRATFRGGERANQITIPKKSKRANAPGAFERLRDHIAGVGGGDRTFRMNFYADQYLEKAALASWLRSAYLAMFSVTGYWYAFARPLDRVRRHIENPEQGLIEVFLCHLPGEWPLSERRILAIRAPEWLRCWAVQFGPYVAFLPWHDDASLYERIAANIGTADAGTIMNAVPFDWPKRPTFGLAVESPSGA